MPFDAKNRGKRAQLSGRNAVVERMDPDKYDDGCLVYTARPLPLDCVWNMTLTTTSAVPSKGLVSGESLGKTEGGSHCGWTDVKIRGTRMARC